MTPDPDHPHDPSIHPAYSYVGKFMMTMIRFPKPVIAAVNGPCIGIGLTILLHVDIIYCTDATYFWTPFARIAVVPEFVSSLLMREILGPSVSNEMLLAQKKLSHVDACRLGLISKSFATKEACLEAAYQTAKEIVSVPLADKTGVLFKSLIKPESRINHLREYFHREMDALNDRAASGETMQAMREFIASKKGSKM